ncbi:hypothetical protein NFF72_14665 [Proteus mirabilis]|uniref:hypothetical protein n=1 Tax=Proteus mirabilis TaxID=584 RepID=UPI0023F62F72|nr:hypothetical protein [Proteus mirabilis]MDF7389976.1 hypothetical protein [Proteus mirabilis]MDF7451075.1 hypothetical protein [Proteus mirabilis]MDM3840044.1 hypothetical protein [Proteus mirabilis]HEK2032670.1 hypothetical protein [Proteus mirabilis]
MVEKIDKDSSINVEGKKYRINYKHRNNFPRSDCTQWIVCEKDEQTFFGKAIKLEYLCSKNCYWWVEVEGKTVKPLRIGRTDINYAFIAKFRSDNNDEWHGYPVTAERAPHDVPPTSILKKWHKLNIFSKREINNIEKGRGYVKACA